MSYLCQKCKKKKGGDHLQADNELLVPEMQKKKGDHRRRFRDKACGKLY